jgi:hypothetical protein
MYHVLSSIKSYLSRIKVLENCSVSSMADQSDHGPQGWDFNFPGEFYLDPMADPANPFAFIDIDHLFTGELWVDSHTPFLHCPISSSMDLFLDNGMWMGSPPTAPHSTNFNEINISNDLDMTLSYQMDHKSDSHTNSSSSGLATPLTPPDPSSFPTQATCQPVSPLPKRPKKRRIEDFQSEFMGPQPVVPDKRRRQPYKNERRMEVGMVRQVGACIRCRIMKTPVSRIWLPDWGLNLFHCSAALDYHVKSARSTGMTHTSAKHSALAQSCWMFASIPSNQVIIFNAFLISTKCLRSLGSQARHPMAKAQSYPSPRAEKNHRAVLGQLL